MNFLVLIMCVVVFLPLGFTSASSYNETSSSSFIESKNLAKPGCESRCGDLIVPYPFGIIFNNISNNCSINKGFDIYCNTSLSHDPRASLPGTDYNRIKLISDSTLRISNSVGVRCDFLNGSSDGSSLFLEFTNSPYTISTLNKFTALGCGSSFTMSSITTRDVVYTGCMVFCSSNAEMVGTGECTGSGCCQSSIPQYIKYFETVSTNLTDVPRPFGPCTYNFVGEENMFKFNLSVNDTSVKEKIESTVPIVLDWAIGNLSCVQAEATTDFACQSNSMCVDTTNFDGYRCVCKQGYQGNPYLSPGCQDIDECLDAEKYPCYGTCYNTNGSYMCECKQGYYGNPEVKDGCRRKSSNVLQLSLGLGLGFLTLLIIGLPLVHVMVKRRKLIKLRQKLFEQNGGLLLENKLKTTGGSAMKIFQVQELEKATNNYAERNILGRGGNGIVYKGILPDTRVVAIKKSQRLDQEQRDQFVNEMVILAQINHRNVVQLMGCCLETDVPLLAYEFVSNDTLYRHIHDRTSGRGRLSWNSRLRIAHESAGALAYLHMDARMSIIHRDVKSTNILLDDNYTAKIADFGASRLVPLGDDQVTTLVQGTIGYLDPEYFHTGQLTGKSDVYSFGVVLAELLTGKKPLDTIRGVEDRNLATYFLKAKKENRLLEILDDQVVKEATDEQLKAASDLICRCLNLVGGNRPSMKDVAMELETMRKSVKQHPWISQENYNETSCLMNESEEHDLYSVPSLIFHSEEHDYYTAPLVANSDTFGEYSSSTIVMKEIMPQTQSPR